MRRTEQRAGAAVVMLAVAAILLLEAPAGSSAPMQFVVDPQTQVLVLMYHQVTDTPIGTIAGEGHFGPAVSPAQFDADLTYLAQNGFAPADPQTAMKYLTGSGNAAPLPAHPYLITFDDGFESAWTNATKILAAHHAKAMMFVEGARTDTTPGRLTSAEIRAMARSDVWEIESHGFAGHSTLRVGPLPTDISPYWYANLAWLPAAHRFETTAEYEARVQADLRKSKQFLEVLSGAPVTIFAYPSGEYGQSVAAPAGAGPATIGADQGHSNAPDLTPRFFNALLQAGFTSAFAVVVPGSETAASPAFSPYALPRIGGSPDKYEPDIKTLADGELRLPVISPDYHWLDCKAVGATAQDMWVASSTRPYVYSLGDATARVEQEVEVGALQAGREGEPTLVGGLVAKPDGTFVAYEQKGWWSTGRPRLISFRLDRNVATDVHTVDLESAANWLVGVAEVNGDLVGLTDGGDVLDLNGPSVRKLFSLPNDAPGWKVDGVGRFAGLAYARGLLYLADRKAGQLLGVDPSSGSIGARSPLPDGSDVRAVGGDDAYLWLVNWAHDRRMLTRLRAR